MTIVYFDAQKRSSFELLFLRKQ
ncbi:MAG: hypothetical protein ACD_5C00035G0002, partial [uncultured bacterium]